MTAKPHFEPACGLVPLRPDRRAAHSCALEPVATATAARALVTPLDDVGGAAFRADLASMRHETQVHAAVSDS
jgi:urease accessory protein